MKENQNKPPRRKSDILLKGALEEYFADVLRFFYADADQIFDMKKGFEWMKNFRKFSTEKVNLKKR